MSIQELSTDFKDDVLDTVENENRKYQMTYNTDGTVSFTDVTKYSQNGSLFGAKEVNEEREVINQLNKRLSDTSYEIIKSSNGYVKKYKNGWFESFIQTITNNSDFAWNQIGTTGLYYAKFANFGFGITATKILNMQMSVSNNGVIWGACPSLNASNSAINGVVVQFGRDTSRSTTIHAYVVGHWK